MNRREHDCLKTLRETIEDRIKFEGEQEKYIKELKQIPKEIFDDKRFKLIEEMDYPHNNCKCKYCFIIGWIKKDLKELKQKFVKKPKVKLKIIDVEKVTPELISKHIKFRKKRERNE